MTRQLPVTTRALAAVAVVLAIAAGGYLGLIVPKRRAIAQLESQVTAASRAAPVAPSAAPISDAERASWRENETNLRARFVTVEDQHRVLVEMAQLARTTGLSVTDLQLENAGAPPQAGAAGAPPVIALPFTIPATLAVNPGIIRLVARHRYGALINFLDRTGRGSPYVAVQSVDTRRAGDHLESDIRMISLRWAQ